MTTELRKAMMKRSHLKNRYDKNRNYENWYLNEKQRDFCVSFLRKKKELSRKREDSRYNR